MRPMNKRMSNPQCRLNVRITAQSRVEDAHHLMPDQ